MHFGRKLSIINNKNNKTESNKKKLKVNNKCNRISTEKFYKNENCYNSRTITLTEKNNKQNKNIIIKIFVIKNAKLQQN